MAGKHDQTTKSDVSAEYTNTPFSTNWEVLLDDAVH